MNHDPVPGSHEPGFVEGRFMQRAVPERVKRQLPLSRGLALYSMGDCSILVARESPDGEFYLWHMSISHPDRHPSWDEIKTARYRLLPAELCFGIFLPPPEHYVNLLEHDHVFHLWEVQDPREQWVG